MKIFLKRLMLFSVGPLVFNFLVFLIVDPIYSQKAYREHFQSQSAAMSRLGGKTIVLADSHGGALDNELLERAGIVNFSEGSDSYEDMRTKLKVIAQKSPIARVVLSADYQNLSVYRDSTNNLQYSDDLKNRIPLRSTLNRYFPLINPSSNTIVFKVVSDAFSKGDSAKELPWETLSPSKRGFAAAHRVRIQFPSKEISKTQRRALADIVRQCRALRVQLIGLKFPLSNEYLDAMKKSEFDFAATDRIFESNEMPVLDYAEHFSTAKDGTAYFKDFDHVNKQGGRLLTELLLRDLRGLSPSTASPNSP